MPGRITEHSSDHALDSATAMGDKYIEMPTKGVPTDGLLDALARQYGKDSFRVEMRHNVFHITIFASRNAECLRQDTSYNAACCKSCTSGS